MTPPVFVRSWGGFGTAPGQFDSPQAVAVGRNGHLYVADSGNHRVQEFTNTGEFVRVWGHPSEGAPGGYDVGGGAFHYPRSIAVDSEGEVIVADSGNQRIQVFSSDGVFLRTWQVPYPNPGWVLNPRSIAIDDHDHLYLIDEGGDPVVKKFTTAGEFILGWGSFLRYPFVPPAVPGTFNLPRGIGIGRGGHAYISDVISGWIQEFTPSGQLVRAWNGPSFYGMGWIAGPMGVATDSRGNLYIADQWFGAVKVFSPRGEFLVRIGGPYPEDGHHLSQPEGVAVDEQGFLFVTDIVNHRIVEYSPLGSRSAESREALAQKNTSPE